MAFRQWERMTLTDIQPENGFAFITRTNRPSLSSHKRPSLSCVLEDGVPLLGPANALHEDIRTIGRGRFSFWHRYVYFSTSDNSDPRTNGRRYEIVYPTLTARLSARFVPGLKAKRKETFSNPESTIGASTSTVILGASPQQEATHQATFQYVPWSISLWKRIGVALTKDSILLDLGCGEGECLDQFRKEGFSIFGCDIAFPDAPSARLKSYFENGIIRKICETPYRIPFEDNYFDIVFSNQVFEHVMDYDAVLAEIERILKPSGIGVHIFPGRWKIKESHTFVPFSSIVKGFWWSYLWALLGFRNQYAIGLSAKETAKIYSRYLKNKTNYLTRAQISQFVMRYFTDFRFVEEAFFAASRPWLADVIGACPFLLRLMRGLHSDFGMRLLVFCKKGSLTS